MYNYFSADFNEFNGCVIENTREKGVFFRVGCSSRLVSGRLKVDKPSQQHWNTEPRQYVGRQHVFWQSTCPHLPACLLGSFHPS